MGFMTHPELSLRWRLSHWLELTSKGKEKQTNKQITGEQTEEVISMSGHAKLTVRARADGGGWKKARLRSRTHLHPSILLCFISVLHFSHSIPSSGGSRGQWETDGRMMDLT